MKKVLAAILVLVMVLGLAACNSYTNTDTEPEATTEEAGGEATAEAGGESSGEVINLMFPTEVTTLDTPNLNGNPDSTIHGSVFEGLYWVDPGNNVVPGVADGMPEISEDGMTYTIKIREDAVWSNGDPVTAHDFVFAWKELADPSKGYLYSFMIQEVVLNALEIGNEEKDMSELGVQALDDYTLEVKLSAPAPYFTSMLTFSPFFPKNEKFVTEQGEQYGLSSDTTLYNGPFTISNWDQNSLSLDLTKNEKYTGDNVAKSEKVHYEIIKEASTALNMFDNGQLDVAELTGEIASQKVDDPNYQAFGTGTISYIRVNHARVGEPTVLANPDLRKALSLGTDKELIASRVIADGSSALNGLIPAGFVNNPVSGVDFREESGEIMGYDPEKAQEHWEAAKAELGDSVTIELMVSDDSRYVSIAEALQGMWQDAFEGLTIDVISLPQDTALARARVTGGSDYDLFLIMWTPDYQDPISTLYVWIDGNSQNYVSDEYNAFLSNAADLAASDLGERWQNLISAEQYLLEDGGTIPVCTNGVATLVGSDIKGMNYNSFSTITNVSLIERQ